MPEIGMKFKLSKQSDKSNWSIIPHKYYNIIYILSEFEEGGEGVVLLEEKHIHINFISRAKQWCMDKSFLKTHFLPIK